MDAEVKIEKVQLKEEIVDLRKDFVVDESSRSRPGKTGSTGPTDTMSPNTGESMKNDIETDAYVEIGCGLNSVADEGQQHVCMNCGGSYASQCALYHHLTRECEEPSQSREETCPFCSFTTEFEEDMNSHVTMKHRNPQATGFQTNERMKLLQFRCLICSKEMLRKEDLDQHIFSEHNEILKGQPATDEISSQYKTNLIPSERPTEIRPVCKPCGKSFKTQQNFRKHVRYCDKTEGNSKKFKCPSCPYESKYKADLSRHSSRMHSNGEIIRHVCNRCGRSYKSRTGLMAHWKFCGKKAEEIVKFKCSHCSHESLRKVHMKQHITAKHPIDPIVYKVCEGCRKSFARAVNLKRHMKYCDRINMARVKFKCFHCLFETKRKSVLRRHIERKHSIQPNERPVCPGCWKSLATIRSLRDHMRYCEGTNAAPVKFKCFHCLFETKWKGALRQHIERKHSIGPRVRPVCRRCEKSFKSDERLKLHLKYCGKKSDIGKKAPFCSKAPCRNTFKKLNLSLSI